MTKPWFRARRYGWGWTPATVQGWLVLGLFLAGTAVAVAIFLRRVQGGADVRAATITFLVWIAVLAAVLIATCWMTGERPGWHWGD